jgi:molecular chaperone GrpE
VKRGSDQDRKPDPEDEESGGALGPSPELEAALREAAAAVPDPEPVREPGEVLLEQPVEGETSAEVARLREELAGAHDRLLRMQADFENFRKRAQRDREEAAQYGAQILVKDLLSVVDNLARAIDHARKSEGGDLEGLLQGVELVRRELDAMLVKHHVQEVEALGKTFNPALHEAMAQLPNPTVAPDTIVEVLQKGYRLRERLLRPARVIVARSPDVPAAGEGTPEQS